MRWYPLKTHWTAQLTPEMDGEEVVLAGWVWEVRDLGKVKFVVLRDREGTVQLTAKGGAVPDAVLEKIKGLNREDVIVVRGTVRSSKIARRGVEVFPSDIQVLSRSKPLPIDIHGDVESEAATRYRYRGIDLKRPRNLAIFRTNSAALRAIRDALTGEGFVEVFTPKIIATSTEGGADLFPVHYFERVAYLAQSPQLYKEQLTASLERVFEVAPAYRAEKHNTDYHLNEFVSVDVEAAFYDYRDVMDVLDVVMRLVSERLAVMRDALASVGLSTMRIDGPIPRVAYDDAVALLRSRGHQVAWGDDLTVKMQMLICEEYGGAVFITEWPHELRPFYTARLPDDPKRTESFDLIVRGIEVASGSTRIHEREALEGEMRARGMRPESFEFHLELYDYGMPPHAGWGLGFNRLMMALLGLSNVRDVVLFPRDRYRVTP